MMVCTLRGLFVCLIVGLAATATGLPPLFGEEPVEQIRPKIGFSLEKVGSHYEPVADFYEAFRLPGTSMRFGPFTYFSPMDEELGVPKWGFLRDDGRFFYLNEPFAQSGDSQYALTGSYFIVDGGAGGSGICRTMYLFRHDRDSMRLLDMIEETYNSFSPPAFESDYPGKPDYGHKLGTGYHDVPVWVIKERDRQGHPLIRLKMVRDVPLTVLGPEEFEIFHIYLKIVQGRLRVALDPYLYEPVFESLGEAGGPDSRSTEYYVSGFLAGKVSLARIKAELACKEERLWLVHSLRNVKKWDRALHERLGEPMPRFVECKPKGR